MKYLKLLLIILTIHSCKGQNDISDLKTTWYEINKQDNKYTIVDCGYEGESFKIKNDSILYHGIMEDSAFKIDHFSKNNKTIFLFNNDKEKYEISWIDKDDGIIQEKNSLDGNKIKYFVNQSNLNKIKRVKGTSKDCISSDEFDDSKKPQIAQTPKKYAANGLWKINCENGVESMSIDGKDASLIVMFNQIYIEMTEVKRFDSENGIAYKLKEIPEDSGSFGAKLPWKEYLNDKTIAYIKVVDGNTILFYWYGFYNQKTKQREITDCDFVQDSGKKEVVLKKCDN